MIPLAPALLSCYTFYIINGTILFIRWRQFKQGMTWFFGHLMLLAPVWASHDTGGIVIGTICLAGGDDWNKVQHYIFGHVIPVLASHDTDGSSIAPLYLLVQDNWMRCNLAFSVIWHHSHWHHCYPWNVSCSFIWIYINDLRDLSSAGAL